MKAEKVEYTVTTVKLTLDRNEAAWLKTVMQNPLHNEAIEEENGMQRAYRKALYDALKEMGV